MQPFRFFLTCALFAAAFLIAPASTSQSQAFDFDGSFSALDLGYDSKWWPGDTEQPASGNPIQVRVKALAAANADASFDGSLALDDSTLTLGPAQGEWGYDFGAAISMQVAINLAFELNNPLPFGDDINIGPWVVDVPYAPDFDLINSQRTLLDSYLLGQTSTLADETEPVSVYDLSLVSFLLGDIDLPDWALAILGLDAGASLRVAIGTVADLTGEAIALSDGTTFTANDESLAVLALPPAYQAMADYQEKLEWDLELIFSPSVFIDILGQRFELPVFSLPWRVLTDQRDMTFAPESVNLSLNAEGEPEGNFEGEPEGSVEGEGEPEGGDDFPQGCADLCDELCVSSGIQANLPAAFIQALPAQIATVNSNTTDYDGDGIADYALLSLLDAVLVDPEAPNHCCVLNAFEANYLAVEFMAGYAGDRALSAEDAARLTLLAAYATLGQEESYAFIQTLASYYEWTMDGQNLQRAAGAWMAAQGDADVDGSCNRGEYLAVSTDRLQFIIAALDTETVLLSSGCDVDCSSASEGETEGAQEGEGAWTLTLVQEGGGTGDVTVTPDLDAYTTGQVVTLTVCVGPNSVFAGWNGTLGIQLPFENGNEVQPVLGTNQYTIAMNGKKKIRPHFLAVSPTEGEPEEGEEEGVGTEGEGAPGEGEGEGAEDTGKRSSADVNKDGVLDLAELLRVIQLFNAGAFYCSSTEPDGVGLERPASGSPYNCAFHTSDYSPRDWTIQLSELLRAVQLFSLGGYQGCADTEDGFCAK